VYDLICVKGTEYNLKKGMYNDQNYWADPSPTSSAREDIAAWPAAVAASLDRFLSASAARHEPTVVVKRITRTLTGFLFSFDLSHNCFNFSKFEILRFMSRRGETID
jgi:hypothetical protein